MKPAVIVANNNNNKAIVIGHSQLIYRCRLVRRNSFLPPLQLFTLVLLVSMVLLMLLGGIADQRSYVIPSSDVVTLSVQRPTQNLDPTASLNIPESYFKLNCLLFNARSVVANLSDFHYRRRRSRASPVLTVNSLVNGNP